MEMKSILTFVFITLLTFPLIVCDDDDGCETLVSTRVVRADESVEDESLFFCHPELPNAYLRCVVGIPVKSRGQLSVTTLLADEEELCAPGFFFSTDMRACVIRELSNCANNFTLGEPSHAQLVCDAYLLYQPFRVTATTDPAKVHLICHDKGKTDFIVCPPNTATAVVVTCVNGTYFSEVNSTCVSDEAYSDCPLDWWELEKERYTQQAGLIQHGCIDCDITPTQRCICTESLLSSNEDSAYACDPHSEDRFLVCFGKRVVCQPCPRGMKWNSVARACSQILQCDPVPAACIPTPEPKPVTTTTTLPPTTTTTPPPTTVTTTTTTTTPPPTTTSCPPTSTIPHIFPQYCEYRYYFHPEKANWATAKRICEANFGNLATIRDLMTQNDLRDRFGSTKTKGRYWIGASDRHREANWRWASGEYFGFTNWYPGQPSSRRNENCLQFNYKVKGAWSDENCDLLKSFICEQRVCSNWG